MCPNKDGPDIYPGKVECNPELEATFQRRRPMNVEVPTNVMSALQSDPKSSVILTMEQQLKNPAENPMLANPVDVTQEDIQVEEIEKKEVLDEDDDV